MNKVNLLIKNNRKLFLNTAAVMPQKSNSGFDLHFEDYKNYLFTWYRPLGRGKIVYIIKKYIKLNPRFFEGLGLSVGDGVTSQSKNNTHYVFGNTNIRLVENIAIWLDRYFGIKRDNLFVYIISKEEDKKFMQKIGRMFKNKVIRNYLSDRHRKPVASIQLSNSIFVALHNVLLPKLHKTILKNKKFRLAFLRGLFAAEGHVKHSKYATLESLLFSYNPKKEKFLADFVVQCLKKDGIKARDNKNGAVYICSYSNMLKIYKYGILLLHKEKLDKFKNLCKNVDVSVQLEKAALKKITNFSQLELAKCIGCSQTSVSNWLAMKKGIELKYFKRIFPFLGLRKSEVLNKIKLIKISNSIIDDKEGIKFLLAPHKFKNKGTKLRIKTSGRVSNAASLFLYLDSVNRLYVKCGYAKSDDIRNLTYRSLITVQQQLQKMRRTGMAKINGRYAQTGFKYALTKKGRNMLNKLSERYEIARYA